MYQLPLFPAHLLTPLPHNPEPTYRTVAQRNEEVSLLFDRDFFAWWGMMLMGSYDRRIVGTNAELTGISFGFKNDRHFSRLKRHHSERGPEVAFVAEPTREKMLRATVYRARNNQLKWRKDKFG